MGDTAFEKTMRGLETGLRVRDIAVVDDVMVCSKWERIDDVRKRADPFDFDNIPVRDAEVITHVVENLKSHPRDAYVEDRATPLTEEMLVTAGEPLVSFLPTIASPRYRLVVDGRRITGVVTASDVTQLPVRLLVFALLTHLEQTMLAAIRRASGEWEAIDRLASDRQEKVSEAFERQKDRELNSSPLELTQFSDKAELLFELGLVEPTDPVRQFFWDCYDLRNAVAHARRYAESAGELEHFLDLLGEMQLWTERLRPLGERP
jgi:hypothetical protein